MAITPEGRWRIWDGDTSGPLVREWVSYRIQVPRSGVGGFDLTFPADAPGASVLIDSPRVALGFEIMAEDGSWSEPPNCRMLVLRRTYDPAAGTVTVSGAGVGWLLGKIIRWPDPEAESDDGKIIFTDRTVGSIMRWLHVSATSRGSLAGLTRGFDSTVDANSDAWERTYSIDVARGVTARQVLDGFTGDGLTWRCDGLSWRIAQGPFDDIATDVPILFDGVDCKADKIEVSLEDSAGVVLATGRDTAYGAASVRMVPEFGRWDVATTQSDVEWGSVLTRAAQDELTRRGLSRSSAMVTLHPSDRWRPFDTITPGQTITVIIDPPDIGPARWGVDYWGSGVVWGSGTPWWRQITAVVEEVTISDDGKGAAASLAIGEQSRSATEMLTSAVSAITGGRIARGALGGRA
jgi:hypothetical protein